MSNDIVVMNRNTDIQISDGAIDALTARIQQMKAFVQTQLREGINNDYAVIPGTPKPSLLKPGAEKILLLFKLGFRFEIVSEQIDLVENVVGFMVKCIVYRKDDGCEVGEYMAYCTNKEKKYVRQNAADIINTILKMCQKRALVGAAIAATGASDYLSQDMESSEAPKKPDASKFTQGNNSGDLGNYQVTFGKHKGQTLTELGKDTVKNYCTWLSENNENPNGAMKDLLDRAREYLRAA